MLKRLIVLWMAVCLMAGAAFAEAVPEAEIEIVTYVEEMPALAQAGQLEVHFIDVKAADCILLRMNGQTLMIDCGHRETAGEVVEYLREIGVEKLDYAFMTHYHNDHIGGFVELFQEVPVGEVLVPDGFADFSSRLYDELAALMAEKRMNIRILRDGDAMELGDAALAFYQWGNEKAGMNDRSMMLRAQLGDRSAIFAADVENNGQKALAEQYGEAMQSDILKMPHHGLAAYMREFSDVVQPVLATFSNYKTKIPEKTLKQTAYRGADWLLTTKGTIVAVTEGETWSVWQ